MADEWTLEDLAQRAARVLAATGVRPPNGRVSSVPDARMIRWYTTIGLVDRPLGMRGRSALYGPRHLLQLVAIKRRQADGRTLAEIQGELTGATDATLHRVAGIAPAGTHAAIRMPPKPERTSRFWARPQVPAPDADHRQPADRHAERGDAERGDAEASLAANAALLHGVRLTDGAVLLLPTIPDAADVAMIRAAAAPLLDLLAERGLLSPLNNRLEGDPA